MKKKNLIPLLMVVLFGIATLFSVNAQTTSDAQTPTRVDADVVPIKCYCVKVEQETKCKALNNGGDLTLCASGTADKPNVKCWEYDENCR
ncbi:hypothetical protein IMCC3317_38070 [Kordia antarctica]|uniref:DUF333 domain-containing protein n=1 Tax=Kordia antarctica TaxID=1218801 RepID=A0A7L4ZRB3_9FLAO|nr:hypothetical protein [Kordia antarctica]QHI38414.1 hypothetical protein IMCC3317_38070 [Kordia antarctica]